MKTGLVALMLLVPLSASAADKAKLRASLRLAHAKAYSVSELLLSVEKPYTVACKDEKSFTTLMMIDMTLLFALETKRSIAAALAAASAAVARDAAAHESALDLVNELASIPGSAAKVAEPAKRCAEFIGAKDDAATEAAPDGRDDMLWSAARMHAGMNVTRLAQFDVADDLKAARALVEKTKLP